MDGNPIYEPPTLKIPSLTVNTSFNLISARESTKRNKVLKESQNNLDKALETMTEKIHNKFENRL